MQVWSCRIEGQQVEVAEGHIGEWGTEKGEDNDNSDNTISKKVCGNVKIGNLSHANKVIKSPYI